MSYFEYMVLYESSNIISTNKRVINDDVCISVLKGKKEFLVTDSRQIVPLETAGYDLKMDVRKIILEETKQYILIKVRTKENVGKEKFCEDKIDMVITLLSIKYGAEIFSNHIYKGWIWKEFAGNGILQKWIKPVKFVGVSDMDDLIKEGMDKFKSLTKENESNFTLMSRFFCKAMDYIPSEEKFVLLWTVLEIFPMDGKNKYHLISDCLSKILDKDASIVADFLGIKELHQYRSKLLHAGEFSLSLDEKSRLFEKIEDIIYVVMQHMLGYSYDNRLDKYFTDYKRVNEYFLNKIDISEAQFINIKKSLDNNEKLLKNKKINYNMIVPHFKKIRLKKENIPYVVGFLYFKYYTDLKEFIENIRNNEPCNEDVKLLVDEIKKNKEILFKNNVS